MCGSTEMTGAATGPATAASSASIEAPPTMARCGLSAGVKTPPGLRRCVRPPLRLRSPSSIQREQERRSRISVFPLVVDRPADGTHRGLLGYMYAAARAPGALSAVLTARRVAKKAIDSRAGREPWCVESPSSVSQQAGGGYRASH